jgi:hypothetical protein
MRRFMILRLAKQVIRWKRMRWVKHSAHVGETAHAYNLLVGKHEGKRPFGA